MEATNVIHTIDPVFDGNSRVLLLGTMPSPRSREAGFFYGHPQNRMWQVLAAVFDDEVPRDNDARSAFLLRHHLAMWDVLAACTITGASDASINDAQPNDLRRIFDRAPIERVFTTGAKATELYRRYDLPLLGVDCVRLPSTSPANAAWSLEHLIEAYAVVRMAVDGTC